MGGGGDRKWVMNHVDVAMTPKWESNGPGRERELGLRMNKGVDPGDKVIDLGRRLWTPRPLQ